GPGASLHVGTDPVALVNLLRLLLTGNSGASTEEMRAALVPTSVVDLVTRLGEEAESGALFASDLIQAISDFEANANRPTEAYVSALAQSLGVDKQVASGGFPGANEQPTMIAELP